MIFFKILLFTGILFGKSDRISVDEIISRIDKNLNSKTRVLTSKMIVHGRRGSRTIKTNNR